MRLEASDMLNSVPNPFGNRKIESSTSSDSNKKHQQQEQPKQEKKYLEQEEPDEVRLGGMPILTEDEILYMTQNYINNLKSEHEDSPKIVQKLDRYLEKFDVQKFMKRNPNITSPEFHMVMFNETDGLIH